MNLNEIKTAINSGQCVKWSNDNYDVIRDSIGQYLIKCNINDSCIGLTGRKGTPYENQLNGYETSFYIKG